MEEEAEKIKFKIDNLASLINVLSSSQRQITVEALDLQGLALAKKRQIRDSIDRAARIGEILDIYIDRLLELSERFFKCDE